MTRYFYWIVAIVIGSLIIISLRANDEVDLGGSYIYDSDCRHITGAIDIPPVVKDYKYNNRYIVAKQTPERFDNVIYDKMEYNYYLGRDTIYYWIIDKQTGNVWGPLDYNKYDSIIVSINAPKEFLLVDSKLSE